MSLVFAALLALQDPGVVVSVFRRGDAGPKEGLKGILQSVRPDGTVTVTLEGAGPVEVMLEELDRIVVGGEGKVPVRTTDPHRIELIASDPLRRAGHLTGTLTSFRDGVFVFASSSLGDVSIPREAVRAVIMGKTKTWPDAGAGDLVIGKGDPRRGKLESIDAEQVTLTKADGTADKGPREGVLAIELERARAAPVDARGLFARLDLVGGGIILGALRGYEAAALKVFSPHYGTVTIPIKAVVKVSVVDRLTLRHGRFLTGNYRMIREMEPTPDGADLKPVWTGQEDTLNNATSIAKLPEGSVLVGDPNGMVLEFRPPASGTQFSMADVTVYKATGLGHVMDVCKMAKDQYLVCENGSDKLIELVADGGRGREIDLGNKGRPIQVKRKRDGNVLVLTDRRMIVEIKPDLEVAGSVTLADGIEGRVLELLDNGNALVVSANNPGSVWEVSPEGKKVWELKNLSAPAGAVRMDDGHTLVAERGHNAIIEYDAAGREVRRIRVERGHDLQCLSYY